MAAVCELTLSAGHIEDLTELGTTHFFLKAIVVVFIIVSLMYMLGTLLKSQKEMVKAARGAGVGSAGAGDNVSFVIASFQSVVKELKDKERELAELKERAEEKARLIESYNESVLKSVQSGVMTFDSEGSVNTLNPAAFDMLGLDSAGAAGKSATELFGEGSWLGGLVMSTIEDARPRQRGEGEVRTPAGVTMWLGAGTSPLTGDDGSLQGVILVFTDLTEVKELRERMELKERMTVLGEMSAGIAHELRNPMAVISGYARLLSKSIREDGSTREAVESILSEIEGMDEIIREFMNFARPTELNIAEVDVGALLEESVNTVSDMSGLVDVGINVEEGLPDVQGDQVLLRQAVLNIMKNAVEAMPGGGSLKVDARAVDAGTEEGVTLHPGRFIRLDFTDTGAGIPRDALAKIFTPFFSTKGRGTGLGLALVQKILVYHGGRATVKSAEGAGTTFRVYLPVAAAGR
jgi:PAS domain S-box-containing protein